MVLSVFVVICLYVCAPACLSIRSVQCHAKIFVHRNAGSFRHVWAGNHKKMAASRNRNPPLPPLPPQRQEEEEDYDYDYDDGINIKRGNNGDTMEHFRRFGTSCRGVCPTGGLCRDGLHWDYSGDERVSACSSFLIHNEAARRSRQGVVVTGPIVGRAAKEGSSGTNRSGNKQGTVVTDGSAELQCRSLSRRARAVPESYSRDGRS